MILDEKKTTVAYRCPGCGAMVRSMIGAFTLSADMMRLKCPCGESDITIVYTPDKKLRLNVPCFFCPKPHNFLVSRNMFFGRELFTLPCAYSGLDICYIGEEKAVLKAAEEGDSLFVAMEKGARAAVKGAEYTKQITARLGRAGVVGEKSIGHPDAGAYGLGVIFTELTKWVKTQK